MHAVLMQTQVCMQCQGSCSWMEPEAIEHDWHETCWHSTALCTSASRRHSHLCTASARCASHTGSCASDDTSFSLIYVCTYVHACAEAGFHDLQSNVCICSTRLSTSWQTSLSAAHLSQATGTKLARQDLTASTVGEGGSLMLHIIQHPPHYSSLLVSCSAL